jgi:AsmA protein
LDKVLRKFNRSQKFNLADVSAFVVAGPFGTAVTKGSDFASLVGTNFDVSEKTRVTQFLAEWKLQDGSITAEDVAFRTGKNRLALGGSFDLVNDSIPGVTIYVVDKNGCSLMEQKISGKIGDIQTGNLKIAKTLLGSVINLVNSVVGSECEPVYEGKIKHPTSIE